MVQTHIIAHGTQSEPAAPSAGRMSATKSRAGGARVFERFVVNDCSACGRHIPGDDAPVRALGGRFFFWEEV